MGSDIQKLQELIISLKKRIQNEKNENTTNEEKNIINENSEIKDEEF